MSGKQPKKGLDMKIALITAAAAVLIAAGSITWWWIHGGEYEVGAYGQATSSVKAILYDGTSARFRDLYTSSAGVICGQVNAKNRFGAFVGYQFFEYDNRHGLQSVRIMNDEQEHTPIDNLMWQSDCGISIP